MTQDDTRRTILPPAEAEGAGNFAAEPGLDPTAGPTDQIGGPDQSIATRQEIGETTPSTPASAEGDEGNRTGGQPVEEIVERRADSAEEAEDMTPPRD